LINIITHVYEVFKTLNIVLNNTLVVETPRSQLVPLAKPIDTTSEQLVNDLIGSSRWLILRMKSGFQKGVMLTQIFKCVHTNRLLLIGNQWDNITFRFNIIIVG
jgi:hypothetical protein